MSQAPRAISASAAAEALTSVQAPERARGVLADIVELAKPGIVKLVVVTSAVGFVLSVLWRGATVGPVWPMIAAGLACILGTALSASGANALNQAIEWRRDAAMHRTRRRPVASGRMSPLLAGGIAMALSAAGVALLWVWTTPAAALVSLATIMLYVLVYTPMKPVSPISTWVGAVPGALPPVIGWCAALRGIDAPAPWGGLAEPGGWAVFLIMFAWQIPHFLAIAWKHREDYARGEFRVLSVVDPTGARTASTSLLWTVVLIGVSLLPLWMLGGLVGWGYAIAALLGGGALLHLSVKLWRDISDGNARRLFLATLIHLPLVLVCMVGDALARSAL